MLVDSHCHLDFPDFADELDQVVERARQSGIGLMLTINTHVSRFPRVLTVAERFDDVYCTVGIHPHEAGNEPATDAETLIRLAEHPKVVGFGETGLDYYYDKSPRDRQRDSFRVHIDAARRTGLPVIIHTRDADDDMAQILTEEMAKGAFPGLVHCFSSGPQLADLAVELGLFISVSGIVTFKKAEALQQVIASVPLDRLLVETDCPYLAPIPYRGKRNEPAYVAHTAAKVAELKGISPETLAAATTANFLSLFAKVRP
ncbi:TatD family hydrolase [Magnetospirillum gryphiswaldense]|uniref:TatD-related deoxyribonuclease n=1 Tax=Magnetospirillum gryphiswaldense TaxID=55518 RepID=A4U1C9_9PROT|nr:TatD family hydrolase [Magnetospirillum gryphiswaldense]AVM73632.1 putative deoxyribonuclease YcfH [Magnetospirillum gryphiswaldense MSR-1]AVM77535.1 putative deoxyribonuclease YcfH [Magnetospirillum gryphiswaldense]CAM76686.1 TatD-related deoxyribonuclease [Magnetospirillum gryphiswaldense MSR-1]